MPDSIVIQCTGHPFIFDRVVHFKGVGRTTSSVSAHDKDPLVGTPQSCCCVLTSGIIEAGNLGPGICVNIINFDTVENSAVVRATDNQDSVVRQQRGSVLGSRFNHQAIRSAPLIGGRIINLATGMVSTTSVAASPADHHNPSIL